MKDRPKYKQIELMVQLDWMFFVSKTHNIIYIAAQHALRAVNQPSKTVIKISKGS